VFAGTATEVGGQVQAEDAWLPGCCPRLPTVVPNQRHLVAARLVKVNPPMSERSAAAQVHRALPPKSGVPRATLLQRI